jgi:hypothetical protein
MLDPRPSRLCNDQFDPDTHFELFIDSGALNGNWDTQGTSGVWDDHIFVHASAAVTFSGPLQTPLLTPSVFAVPQGGAVGFTLEVHDDLLNPLVGGSTISVTSNAGTVIGGAISIPDGHSFNQLVNGLTLFNFVLADNDATDGDPAAPASITVTVTSQNGNGSFVLAGGTVD